VNPVPEVITGHLVTGYMNTGTWSSRLRVWCNAEDLTLQKKKYIFYEIQRSENRMQSGRIFQGKLYINKDCFSNDDDDDYDNNNNNIFVKKSKSNIWKT
jgi:hypothetical protein